MERKIGEIFEYNGEWYQCVKGDCTKCDFLLREAVFLLLIRFAVKGS